MEIVQKNFIYSFIQLRIYWILWIVPGTVLVPGNMAFLTSRPLTSGWAILQLKLKSIHLFHYFEFVLCVRCLGKSNEWDRCGSCSYKACILHMLTTAGRILVLPGSCTFSGQDLRRVPLHWSGSWSKERWRMISHQAFWGGNGSHALTP